MKRLSKDDLRKTVGGGGISSPDVPDRAQAVHPVPPKNSGG